MSSPLNFARSHGAVCVNPRYAWSFINHEKKFVIFGAWKHMTTKNRCLILSSDWRLKPNKHRNPGYTASLPHIEYVLEHDYKLLTFPQVAVSGTENRSGPTERESFQEELSEKFLQIVGNDYFAVDINSSPEKSMETDPTDIWEGNAKQTLTTHYERNPLARLDCLREHGYSCKVCDLNFSNLYGKIGLDYIHVHHIVPISKRKRPYKINGAKDLVPLCPNCHAMTHKRIPPYSTDELKGIMSKAKTP